MSAYYALNYAGIFDGGLYIDSYAANFIWISISVVCNALSETYNKLATDMSALKCL